VGSILDAHPGKIRIAIELQPDICIKNDTAGSCALLIRLKIIPEKAVK
jgi:hypothetical protein